MGKKVLKDNKIAKQRKREEARRKASRSRRIDLVIKYGPVFGTLVLGKSRNRSSSLSRTESC